jgi:hypothetical protein
MGNWRTVNITGTMTEEDAGVLGAWLGYTIASPVSGTSCFDHFGPLSFSREKPSLCGLNNWVAPVVFACGNLAERDYTPEDVAEELRRLLAVAPSMRLKVHCGGDHESDTCVATVTVADGQVVTGPPEVERVAAVSEDQAVGNLLRAIARPAGARQEPADAGDQWDCEAYGPEGSEAGALCFIAGELDQRACSSPGECHQAMASERQRVVDRINELAAEGDPTGVYLAGHFKEPGQLLGGGGNQGDAS